RPRRTCDGRRVDGHRGERGRRARRDHGDDRQLGSGRRYRRHRARSAGQSARAAVRARCRGERVMTAVSELFDASRWTTAEGFGDLTDITYHHDTTGRVARVAFNRPEVRNAFRPHTVDELARALDDARMNPRIGVVLLTGNGPSPKDGGWAFCSGGDQRIRGTGGYEYPDGTPGQGRLHILEVQRLIRFMPKVVIAVVPGWAAGGGHSLHVVCDLTIASREHGRFKQTDA